MTFKKGDPKPEGSGRQPNQANRITSDLKAMILGALDDAGGRDYLAIQAKSNPGAFMTLVGKVLPHQVTGPNDGPVQVEMTLEQQAEEARASIREAFAEVAKEREHGKAQGGES
jgi:hypothetical protein